MFCPNCRTEYMEGITVCADCSAKLVVELTPESHESELVTVLEARDLAIVALAKSILDEAGIEYVAKGELPMEQLAVGPMEIQVDKNDAEQARDLLADLEDSAPAEGLIESDFPEGMDDTEEEK
jgi:hypothetical protein